MIARGSEILFWQEPVHQPQWPKTPKSDWAFSKLLLTRCCPCIRLLCRSKNSLLPSFCVLPHRRSPINSPQICRLDPRGLLCLYLSHLRWSCHVVFSCAAAGPAGEPLDEFLLDCTGCTAWFIARATTTTLFHVNIYINLNQQYNIIWCLKFSSNSRSGGNLLLMLDCKFCPLGPKRSPAFSNSLSVWLV